MLRVVGQPLADHGFVTLYSDTTEQRRAERTIREHNLELEQKVAERTAELRRSEQQIRLITDSIPALVAYVDRTRTYRYVNRGYRDWFGLDPAQPGSISARSFLGAATFESIKPHVVRAFAGQAVNFEYELTRIDGSRIRARTSLIPDLGADGIVEGCFELTFDITERQRAQELVLRAQKMEALGHLTGGLAHDFNNLLTVVIGNLGLLAEQRCDAPETHEFVEPALQAARRGADLIRRLLSFARQQPLKAEAVDAVQAVTNVARMLRSSMPGRRNSLTKRMRSGRSCETSSEMTVNEAGNFMRRKKGRVPRPGSSRQGSSTGDYLGWLAFMTSAIFTGAPPRRLLSSAASMNAMSSIVSSGETGATRVWKNVTIS